MMKCFCVFQVWLCEMQVFLKKAFFLKRKCLGSNEREILGLRDTNCCCISFLPSSFTAGGILLLQVQKGTTSEKEVEGGGGEEREGERERGGENEGGGERGKRERGREEKREGGKKEKEGWRRGET